MRHVLHDDGRHTTTMGAHTHSCRHPVEELMVGDTGVLVCGSCLTVAPVSPRVQQLLTLGAEALAERPGRYRLQAPAQEVEEEHRQQLREEEQLGLAAEHAASPASRGADPDTSRAAAKLASRTAGSVARAVLRTLRLEGPLTDELLADLVMLQVVCTPQSVRSRRAELVRAKMVKAVGKHGTTRAGNPCTVWAVVDDNERSS